MTTVAIVHYHLDPGGVTNVIATTSRCLTKAGIHHVILAGSGSHDLPVRIIPELGYSHGGNTRPDELMERLRSTAADAIGQPPDIWHFHNPSLGKNPLIPAVVALLAEANERLVLQLHDLAEDGRPDNYRMISEPWKLYPVSPTIHYAFLNSRDQKTFTDAGLPPDHSSVLPNPIEPHPHPTFNAHQNRKDQANSNPPHPIVFAPVRGIRRKNLGELVFLSALAPANCRFAVSRAPANPDALAIHEIWRKFAHRHQLPVEFDVVDRIAPVEGEPSGFESWMKHTTHIVTTSVAEGFGLPFLEAAASGKPLIGRNLPHLAADHARHGIQAGDLYDRLLIPIEWIEDTILHEYLNAALERNHRAYGRRLPSHACDETMAAMIHGDRLDFGNLPEALQQSAIERLADPHCRMSAQVAIHGKTRPAQEWLEAALMNRKPGVSPDQLAPYSPDSYSKNLIGLYSHLSSQAPGPAEFLSAGDILTKHLVPSSFHFLLSSSKSKSNTGTEYRAAIFDIYGTLLIAPPGGVKPDPSIDPVLRKILALFGHEAPESPTTALHAAVLRHHAAANTTYPEVDLRTLWREVLSLGPDEDTEPLVKAIESAWHPSQPMPGAMAYVKRLARSGTTLGLLSNAQFHTLSALGEIRDLFTPELTLLSYEQGIAKPSPELFELLASRLAELGIQPAETLYIGNDPLQDIIPAAAHGFKTALFAGHPSAIRPGQCTPDHVFNHWPPP